VFHFSVVILKRQVDGQPGGIAFREGPGPGPIVWLRALENPNMANPAMMGRIHLKSFMAQQGRFGEPTLGGYNLILKKS
jgi:hypothetical protein